MLLLLLLLLFPFTDEKTETQPGRVISQSIKTQRKVPGWSSVPYFLSGTSLQLFRENRRVAPEQTDMHPSHWDPMSPSAVMNTTMSVTPALFHKPKSSQDETAELSLMSLFKLTLLTASMTSRL